MLDILLPYFKRREVAADLFSLVCLIFAWQWPLFADPLLSAIERLGTRLANRKGLAIVLIGAAAVLIRLSLLPWMPVPVPRIHDEFSYLLAADTFVHGRLTNPPHAMSVFFDTIHVNQLPTYMSKYPPAQGAALALGQLLGNPWIGVVLSVAGMCAAALWMLQGWLPPQWALLGGILVLLRLGISSYWMNSYWGGAVPAIGGALVVGALPRLIRSWRPRDAVLLTLGAAILVNSRPLEGLVFCLPVAAVLIVWLFGRRSPPWRVTLARVILPVCAVMALCAIFTGYYNWRGTGNPFLLPYVLNDRTYITTPVFIWQDARLPLHYANPQFEDFYNRFVHDSWVSGRVANLRQAAGHLESLIVRFIFFFLWPELFIPLIALPWLLRDRRTRFLTAQAGIVLLGCWSVIWFFPHYAAPLTATVFALLTQGLRHIRRWRFRGRPVGIGVTRIVVLLALALAPIHRLDAVLDPGPPDIRYRSGVAAKLNALPGEHLVIVRYPEDHDSNSEWVFNAADIDHAKVVWAREIPGVDIGPLLKYFSGRRVWLVEPDESSANLGPYTGPDTAAP